MILNTIKLFIHELNFPPIVKVIRSDWFLLIFIYSHIYVYVGTAPSWSTNFSCIQISFIGSALDPWQVMNTLCKSIIFVIKIKLIQEQLTAAATTQRAISLLQCWYAWKLVLHIGRRLSSQLAASSEQNQYKQTNLFLKLSCCLKSAAHSCHAPAFFILAHYLQLPKRKKYIYTYIQKGTIPHLDCGLRSMWQDSLEPVLSACHTVAAAAAATAAVAATRRCSSASVTCSSWVRH